MSTVSTVDIQARLAAIRSRYALRLSGQVDRLVDSLAQFRGENCLESLLVALQIAHQLHGTAGTMGFSNIGHTAAALEVDLKAVVNDPDLAGLLWGRVGDNAHRLRALVRETTNC